MYKRMVWIMRKVFEHIDKEFEYRGINIFYYVVKGVNFMTPEILTLICVKKTPNLIMIAELSTNDKDSAKVFGKMYGVTIVTFTKINETEWVGEHSKNFCKCFPSLEQAKEYINKLKLNGEEE